MMNRVRSGLAAAALGALAACSSSAPPEEVASVSAAIHDGELVDDNTVRAVRIEIPADTDPSQRRRGSGVLLKTGAEHSAFLTAAHVLLATSGRRRTANSIDVLLEEQSTDDEEFDPEFLIPHPSFLIPRSQTTLTTGGTTLDRLLALDMAILLTNRSTTQPSFVNPLTNAASASALLNQVVDVFGYGPLAFDDGDPGLNTFSTRVAGVEPVRMIGSASGNLGFSLTLFPNEPGGGLKQFIVGGDSGGPVLFQNRIVGVNSLGPKREIAAKVTRVTSVFGMEEWINAAVDSDGAFLESNIDQRERLDQVFMLPGGSELRCADVAACALRA